MSVIISRAPAPGQTEAAHVCPAGSTPVHFAQPANPADGVWLVEGKITAFSRQDRTVTANGATFSVPLSVNVKTISLDQAAGNIPFADADPATPDLTDPALEAARTIIGGTAIAEGNSVFTSTAEGLCMSLVATSMFVELAENVMIGLLESVNPTEGSLIINGALVRSNTDPRFPSDILDIAGNLITIEDLVGTEGSSVTVVGYFDLAAQILYGVSIETGILKQQVGKDTVVIDRAQGRPAELRVRGLVFPHPDTGVRVATVDIHEGLANAEGTQCPGLQLGTASVDPLAGSWDFRLRNSALVIPSNVCVISAGGGVADLPVALN